MIMEGKNTLNLILWTSFPYIMYIGFMLGRAEEAFLDYQNLQYSDARFGY